MVITTFESALKQWLVLVLLGLFQSLGIAQEQRLDIPCFGEELSVYLEEAKNPQKAIVVFVPSEGYMDHRGFFSDAVDTSFGLFENWRMFFSFMGYSTVTYDKLGTGSSTGRLASSDDASLFCVLANSSKLPLSHSRQIFLVSFGESFDVIASTLPTLGKISEDTKILGVIQMGGTYFFPPEFAGPLPVYSLVGGSLEQEYQIKKFNLQQQIFNEPFSEIEVIPGRNLFLCSTGEKMGPESCRVPRKYQFSVQKWMDKLLETWAEESKEYLIDLNAE